MKEELCPAPSAASCGTPRKKAWHRRQVPCRASKTVIELSKDGYPELEEKQSMIFKVLTGEEDKFNKTIDQGLAILAEMEDAMAAAGEKTLSGENAFKLYDTYGFPVDLTKEILEEKGCTVDEEGFAAAMKEQKDKARKARKTTNTWAQM